jgi:hypothetical protein
MAAKSNKPGDLVLWVEKVIDSCETPLQEITAKKLIRLLEQKLDSENYPKELKWAIHRSLRDRLDRKLYTRLK